MSSESETTKKVLRCPYGRLSQVKIEIGSDNLIKDHRAVFMLKQGLVVKINSNNPEFFINEINETEKSRLFGIGMSLPEFGFTNGKYVWISYHSVRQYGKQAVIDDLPALLLEKYILRNHIAELSKV